MSNTLNIASRNVCGLRSQDAEHKFLRELTNHRIDVVGVQEMMIPSSEGNVRALRGGYYSYIAAPRSSGSARNIGVIFRTSLITPEGGYRVESIDVSERIGHFKFTHRAKDLCIHVIVLHLPTYNPKTTKAALKLFYKRYKAIRSNIPSGPRHVVITTGDFNTSFDRNCRVDHPHEFGDRERQINNKGRHGFNRIAAGMTKINNKSKVVVEYKQKQAKKVLTIMQGATGDAFPIADFPRKIKHLMTYKPRRRVNVEGEVVVARQQLIDFITISKRYRKCVTNYYSTYPNHEVSDHSLVVCKININKILRRRRVQGRWKPQKGTKWRWFGSPLQMMMNERKDDVDIKIIKDSEQMNAHMNNIMNYYQLEINRKLELNNIDVNNLTTDQRYTNLLNEATLLSDMVLKKNNGLYIARLKGRVGTRKKERPEDFDLDRLNGEVPNSSAAKKKYFETVMWQEAMLTNQYDILQLHLLELLTRKLSLEHRLLPVFTACRRPSVNPLLTELEREKKKKHAMFLVKMKHIAGRIQKRRQIRAAKDRLATFRDRYHTVEYGMWFTDMMAASMKSEDIQDVYTKNKIHKRKKCQPTKIRVFDERKNLVSRQDVVARVFRDTIQKKLNTGLKEVSAARLDEYTATAESFLGGEKATEMNRVPNRVEVSISVKTLNNSASSDIMPAAFKLVDELFIDELFSIVEKIWNNPNDHYVKAWSVNKKMPVFKGKGKDPHYAKNYRNITLQAFGRKVFNQILLKRISKHVFDNIPDYQVGFMKGRGCTDALLMMQNVINVCKRNRQSVTITLVDLVSAYPSVHRGMLMEVLKRCGYLTPKLVSFIECMYRNTANKVVIGKTESTEFITTRGLEEGCALSPILFVIYVEAMFKHLKQITPPEHRARHAGIHLNVHNRRLSTALPIQSELHKILYHLVYADDLTFYHPNPASAKLNMVYVVRAFHAFGLDIDLRGDKCEFIVVNANSQIKRQAEEYTIGGINIKKVPKAKYLGSIVSSMGVMKAELDQRLKMVKFAFKSNKTQLKTPDFSTRAKMNFFHQLLFANMAYGAQSWNLIPQEYTRIDTLHTKLIRRALGFFRGLNEDPMSNDDIYAAARVNKWSMRIKSHILVHYAKMIPRKNTSSLRYRCIFLDKLHDGNPPLYLQQISQSFPQRQNRSVIMILKNAMESFDIPMIHQFTNEELLPLDALYEFGRKVPEGEVVDDDGENRVFAVNHVREKLKEELIAIRNTRKTEYEGKRLPNYRYFNPVVRGEDEAQVSDERRGADTIVIYTDGSTKNASRDSPADASWAFVTLNSNDINAPLQPTALPRCGRVITLDDSPHFIGATRKTNNTAELTAIAEALSEFISSNLDNNGQQVRRLLMCIDSLTSIRWITGRNKNTAHWELVKGIQLQVLRVTKTIEEGGMGVVLELMHVSSHTGIKWNECVDKYAKYALQEGNNNQDRHNRILCRKYQYLRDE